MAQDYKDLIVWQKAIDLTLLIYKLTQEFPKSEIYGLTSQMRRASISVASNIAEGYGKSSKGEYLLYLGHARGSNFEVQTQLVLAEELGFGSATARCAVDNLSQEVSRMLVSLMRKLGSAK